MTQRITIELSDLTIRRARETAQQTNRTLELVLSAWLEQVAGTADIYPLDTHTTYRIDTPFGAEATAQSLLEMLQGEDDQNHPTRSENHAI